MTSVLPAIVVVSVTAELEAGNFTEESVAAGSVIQRDRTPNFSLAFPAGCIVIVEFGQFHSLPTLD